MARLGEGQEFEADVMQGTLPAWEPARNCTFGQKSGVVYAFDPANGGNPLWQARVGKGGKIGRAHV